MALSKSEALPSQLQWNSRALIMSALDIEDFRNNHHTFVPHRTLTCIAPRDPYTQWLYNGLYSAQTKQVVFAFGLTNSLLHTGDAAEFGADVGGGVRMPGP
ncbi:hypothetical protein DPMN_166582 [Dreissena polymorpha]|uniref:Uncharacterized protein n=1 Tax=Dreissena polymorpha TaxID=45954 RepID=A0A9D4EYW0_DREPO|nr:hypothetical protein DPMN_166582 [Dreissena polymorpha]